MQMTVNVEKGQVGYSSRVNLKDKVETIIKYYWKKEVHFSGFKPNIYEITGSTNT